MPNSIVELDTRIGRIMAETEEDWAGQEHAVFYTTDNGAWQDVYPDAGYTPFRGTKGTLREGGNRVPAIAVWPGKIAPRRKNHEIIGGLDLMATFASVAGVPLPTKDREDKPIIFDSYDMTPVLDGTGPSPRTTWFYFTEDELSPGAMRFEPVQVRLQPARRRRRADRRAGRRHQPRLEGARNPTSPPCRRSSTSVRIRRNATTSS